MVDEAVVLVDDVGQLLEQEAGSDAQARQHRVTEHVAGPGTKPKVKALC